jgi:origin recognition complex subunit 5
LSSLSQIEAVQEAKLRGPHPFPLERLLSICWALLDADTAASDEAPPLDAVDRQSAEAFMQISSLVSLQLLSQASALDYLTALLIHCDASQCNMCDTLLMLHTCCVGRCLEM